MSNTIMRDNRGEHGNGDFRVPVFNPRPLVMSPAITARSKGELCKGCSSYCGFYCEYDADIEETAAEQGMTVKEYFADMTFCPFASPEENEEEYD